jgi:hypothetical protein
MITAFKFVSEEAGRRILESRKIRVTQFTALNDTVEGLPNIIWPTDSIAIDKWTSLCRVMSPQMRPQKRERLTGSESAL